MDVNSNILITSINTNDDDHFCLIMTISGLGDTPSIQTMGFHSPSAGFLKLARHWSPDKDWGQAGGCKGGTMTGKQSTSSDLRKNTSVGGWSPGLGSPLQSLPFPMQNMNALGFWKLCFSVQGQYETSRSHANLAKLNEELSP